MDVANSRIVYRVHAIKRMFERSVSTQDVRDVLAGGQVIEDYPNDTPYPSKLMLGWCGTRPVHVVVAENTADSEIIVITVYEPDPAKWEPGFQRRMP